jgi:HEPN superfamily Swt1-like protein
MEQSPSEVRLIEPGVKGTSQAVQRSAIRRQPSQRSSVEYKQMVGRALELLRDGLIPFVERELAARIGPEWLRRLDAARERALPRTSGGRVAWDSQALLKVMIDNWQSVFRLSLRHLERSWSSELLDIRNRFAHEQPFNSEDTHRALDTAQRLLIAVSAPRQAAEVEGMKAELLRSIYGVQG